MGDSHNGIQSKERVPDCSQHTQTPYSEDIRIGFLTTLSFSIRRTANGGAAVLLKVTHDGKTTETVRSIQHPEQTLPVTLLPGTHQHTRGNFGPNTHAHYLLDAAGITNTRGYPMHFATLAIARAIRKSGIQPLNYGELEAQCAKRGNKYSTASFQLPGNRKSIAMCMGDIPILNQTYGACICDRTGEVLDLSNPSSTCQAKVRYTRRAPASTANTIHTLVHRYFKDVE
jgi:hypothetical protein